MKHRNSEYIILSFIIMLLPLWAYAQDDDTVMRIPEIIVSAERTEQSIRNTAATVSVLSATEVNKSSITTFDQALEAVPGVMLNRAAGTATNSMSIRGASDVLGGGIGNRVLLLIDGRPAITADTDGANWSMLPLDVMERVEVVKGALSPLYGSSAMGGVVNFITKSPTQLRDTKISLSGGFYQKPSKEMRYTDKTNFFSRLGIAHSNTYRNLGYVLSLSANSSDGHRQNTDFSLYNAYGKLQYKNDNDLKIGMSLNRTYIDRGYPYAWLVDNRHPYIHPLEIPHSKINDRQEKRTWDVDLFLKTPIKNDLKLSANIYRFQNYSRSLYNQDNMEGDDMPYGFFTDSDANKSGGLIQLDFYGIKHNYLISGFDLQLDSVDSNPPDIMYGNHNARTLAGFIQDRIRINDKLALTLGTRYDYRNISEDNAQSQISPKLAISYQLRDNTALRFSIGQAFRAPSLGELYLRQEIHSGIKFRDNPDLRAEKLRLYAEFGIKHNIMNLLRNDTSIFIYDYSDMIFWKSLDANEFQVVNLNRALIKGFETGFNLSWKGLTAITNYTYLDAQDKTVGRIDDTLPYKPKHTAFASAYYEYKKIRPQASIRYVSKIEEAIFYNYDAPKAFYVVNFELSYGIFDGIIMSMGINNLLNRQYEEMARYRMPGRSFIFRIFME